MNVELLAHTQISKSIEDRLIENAEKLDSVVGFGTITYGQIVALAAIRQCYSYKTALEVLDTEFVKYFGDKGKEGKRLFNQIVKSGHTSTLEHISFTFAVEGVSRSLLAQLTRHRVGFSYSVQSQRYVQFGSESRSGGFDYVVPENFKKDEKLHQYFTECMEDVQCEYDNFLRLGVPQEDCRALLPNAAATNLVLTVNLRALLDFYRKRKPGKGAQHEITVLAEKLKKVVVEVEPWTAEFFEME
ncbi:FAD-dependent thymidylate synthase [Lysinibacillus sp. CD3-6]|uniref:FAD-dependent thymidylate synthase n=1 Tax=Lysinibacillus sp. CD3-6 TaxID=2892541 RepID=UPI00111D85B7|nr:FAD-dependent thymidylate synthase [Lysinibacillus sp. CD3-6]UED82593.1 FAD-dependent thymidylate synthase [Lysinibacillus sp. CD3-6]